MKKAVLILADGTTFEGVSAGADGQVVGELIFTTAIANYMESLTDPCYEGKILTMTNTQIGNVGVNGEDRQSELVCAKGMVMRQMCDTPSNWRCEGGFREFLRENGIVAIEQIDTRELTRILRSRGSQTAMITTAPNALFDLSFILSELARVREKQPAASVSGKRKDVKGGGRKAAVIDLGIKNSVLDALTMRDFDLKFYDLHASAEEILSGSPDGVFVSNGPGNPADIPDTVETVKALAAADLPIFGVDLGHLVIAAAMGLKVEKMLFGHNGANQPVNDFEKDRTFITAQTHSYVVSKDGFDSAMAHITHENNNDNTIEGIRYTGRPVFSVQFIPDAKRGVDTAYLYDRFDEMMGGRHECH